MTVVRGLLDPATAAVLEAALQHFRTLTSLLPHPVGEGHGPNRPDGPDGEQTTLPIRDDRSRGQRNVDAMKALCAAALRAHYPTMADGGPGRQPAAPLVKVVVVATPEQAEAARRTTPAPLDLDGAQAPPPGRTDDWSLDPPGESRYEGVGLAHEAETGDPLSPRTLGRLLCDAELQTVVLGANRAVLDLGRTTRLATAPQRTALVARDRGCAVPGCAMPPSACEAHHVTWWRNGGTTDIENLALLCGRHHTLIHSDSGWALQMRDGVPYVVAPHWLDPTRTQGRNTVFDAAAEARRLGRRRAAAAASLRRVTPGRMNLLADRPERSHLDLTGSKVFGWLTMNHSTSEVATLTFPGQRGVLVQWGRDAAAAAGIDLTPFRQVLVVHNYGSTTAPPGTGS